MKFHMELFSSSNGTSGANTFIQTNYFNTGNIVPQLNNGLNIPQQLPFLHTVMGLGVSLCHVRPQTPNFLPYPYWTLTPNNRGTSFESPARIWDFSKVPIAMKPTDELDIFTTQNSGGAETEYVGVNITDGPPTPVPAGMRFTVHGAATTTLAAAKWSTVNFTYDQTIPAGRYAIVGMRAFAATGKFARLIPTEAPNYRPGGIVTQAYDAIDPHGQRGWDYLGQTDASWGVWIYTNSYVMPQVEFFSTSADTAEEIWFDMVLVGGAFIPQAL
jgi:hypothetical protein